MTLLRPAIVSVHVGPVGTIGPAGGTRSAFVKQRVDLPVAVSELGLAGDAQADLRVHGGPEKAVYVYPSEHYVAWTTAYPEHAVLMRPGGMGENLSVFGLTEDTTMIGDVVRVGRAVLQVTQPRQPCFKLALRFNDRRLGQTMRQSGMSGWYVRVIEVGLVGAGDEVNLVERPNPEWPVRRFAEVMTRRTGTAAEFAELAEMPGLASVWREQARQTAVASRSRKRTQELR